MSNGFADAIPWEEWTQVLSRLRGRLIPGYACDRLVLNWQYIPQNGPGNLFVDMADLADIMATNFGPLLLKPKPNELNSGLTRYGQKK